MGRQPALPAVEQPRPTASDTLCELRATGLAYRDPTTGGGITDVDLLVCAGEFVVITGRVGAGKTTLLRALQGLLPLQASVINWNGVQVDDPATFFVPPRSAYTPQVPRLISSSLRDNLLLGLETDEATIAQALHLAVFERDLAAMPNGLATLVGAKGVRLSGGQRLRAAAARMLVCRPDLLIVDDLSSALDVETERWLWERLRQATNRRPPTVLAVSHRPVVRQRTDRIIVLDDGQIVACGRLTELLQTSPILRQIWHSTTHGTGNRGTKAQSAQAQSAK